jgi:ATP-dependent DNA helicase RecG
METMVRSSDGFEIAEVDLKLRGPGDIMGTQQSGVLRLKIANIVQDKVLLSLARTWAKKVLKEDPKLSSPKHLPINKTYTQMGKYKNMWNYIS